MGIWAKLVLGVSVFSSPAWSQNRDVDSWIAEVPALPRDVSCHSIEQDLVVPVGKAARAEAVAMLVHLQFLPLKVSGVARFTGESDSDGSAAAKVSAARARLEQEKEKVLGTRTGSWGGAQELRIVQLERLQSSARLADLRPFLVRGVAGYEFTGAYSVAWCGEDLSVTHVSLGDGIPPPIRLPVIVYLEKQPAHVHVGLAVAR